MESMVASDFGDLAVDISRHDEDREDHRDVLLRAMLARSQPTPRTREHLRLFGAKHHAREDEDVGPARLRVFFHAEVLLLGGASQEHSAMHASTQRGLAQRPTEPSSEDHDEGRGEGPTIIQILHSVHVLRRFVIQHDNAIPVANIRAERHCSADGLSRLRRPLQSATDAGLRVRLLPAMRHRHHHVQYHHGGLLSGSYVCGTRVRPDRHRHRADKESCQGRETQQRTI